MATGSSVCHPLRFKTYAKPIVSVSELPNEWKEVKLCLWCMLLYLRTSCFICVSLLFAYDYQATYHMNEDPQPSRQDSHCIT